MMVSKSFLIIVLMALLVVSAIAWRRSESADRIAPSQTLQQAGIEVIVEQLPPIQGVGSVEILRPKVSSTAPNEVEDVVYVVRNNTDKTISAIAIRKTVAYRERGIVNTFSTCSTSDYAFHTDISASQLFGPGSEVSMDASGPMRLDDDVVVKAVTLQVDYVLFADGTALGKGGEGERKINSMRLGARKYKRWLVQRYARSGKSFAAILPLLKENQAPLEVDLGDMDQILGAERYRLHLLKKLQTTGPNGVDAYLNE